MEFTAVRTRSDEPVTLPACVHGPAMVVPPGESVRLARAHVEVVLRVPGVAAQIVVGEPQPKPVYHGVFVRGRR